MADSSEPQNPELHESLRRALADAHLESFFTLAINWCAAEGAWGLEELVAEDIFPDFAKDIGLKRLGAKRLKESILVATGKLPATAAASGSPAANVSRDLSSFPDGRGGLAGVVVKNTFLDDIRPSATDIAGNRSNTVPIHLSGDVSQDEEEDDDEEATVVGQARADEAGAASKGVQPPSSPLIIAGSPNPLQSKLMTFDAYEPCSYWEWPECAPEMPSLPGEPSKVKTEAPPEQMAVNEANVPQCVPMPPQMWAMPPMMFPMMPMDMAAQAQMQMMGGVMMGQSAASTTGYVAQPKPRSQVMERAFSTASQLERICWTIDARKLRSSDREAVSPTFEVSCGAIINFKLVLKPKVMDSNKGGACFKTSRKKGYVELRCVTDLENAGPQVKPTITFRLQISSKARTESSRGPVRHNFADRAMCGLPEGQDEWDFGKVVDHSNNTFGVILELIKDDS